MLCRYCPFCFSFLGYETVPFTEKEIDEAVMPFGKHMGERIDSLPANYLGWLRTECKLKGVVKFAVAKQYR